MWLGNRFGLELGLEVDTVDPMINVYIISCDSKEEGCDEKCLGRTCPRAKKWKYFKKNKPLAENYRYLLYTVHNNKHI